MDYIAPGHISALSLRNFRGFRHASDIAFAPLTFLVGQNSSGKSSLLDAILLLAQSGVGFTDFTNVPIWRGKLVDLGSFQDAVFRHKTNLKIEMGITIAGSRSFDAHRIGRKSGRRNRFPLSMSVVMSCVKGDSIGRFERYHGEDDATGASFAVRNLRSPLSTVLELDGETVAQTRDYYGSFHWLERELAVRARGRVGRRFSFAAWDRLRRGIHDPRRLLLRLDKVGADRSGPKRWYPAEAKTGRWREQKPFDLTGPEELPHRSSKQLSELLGQLDIASSVASGQLSPYHSVIRANDSITGVQSNLMDLGYGTSQVIPILLSMLSDNRGPLLVEQPESHLHPRAQATLGDQLAVTSRRRQVIVETHSAHVINRARVLVAKGDVPPEHVMINFVQRTKKETKITPIALDERGEFTTEWPEGFFEERYQETLELLALKSAREKQ